MHCRNVCGVMGSQRRFCVGKEVMGYGNAELIGSNEASSFLSSPPGVSVPGGFSKADNCVCFEFVGAATNSWVMKKVAM